MPKKTISLLLMALVWILLTVSPLLAQDATEEATEEATETPSPAATATSAATATQTPAAAATLLSGYEYYTVQAGDTLFRIAVRFRTNVRHLADVNGIVNPSLIYAGQRIQVPSVQQATAVPTGTAGPTPTPAPTSTPAPATATPVPTATLVPGSTTTYTVVVGDTLFRIAVRNHTTVARLLALNSNITNPNLIYVGQSIVVPTDGAASAGSTTQAAQPAATEETEQAGGSSVGFGVEAFLIGQDTETLIGDIQSMGLGWVKVEVLWRDLEPVEGEIDFDTLDTIVAALEEADLSILFTVTSAPSWARSSAEESGPPDDFATLGTFVGALAEHYAGRVQAYEIWSEPNLRREWNSSEHTINAGGYMQLLQVAYEAIKAADADALVVSAGLSPTGYNDGVNAINDRLFLQGMYASGLEEYSDAVGAHPSGWANPPDSRCCDQPEGVASHYQDPSFFFLDTLSAYHDIMVENGDGDTPIWVTRFSAGHYRRQRSTA
ncbi:MAG: LysM peptidoglycan-binding domain-containing protein [Anaerolineae bacterium]